MEVKRIDIAEFREFGFLQELNRQFLHPLGLALEVVVDTETGEEKLGGICDSRDDPEGILYAENMLDREKAERVARLAEQKCRYRFERLGHGIQPLPVNETLMAELP